MVKSKTGDFFAWTYNEVKLLLGEYKPVMVAENIDWELFQIKVSVGICLILLLCLDDNDFWSFQTKMRPAAFPKGSVLEARKLQSNVDTQCNHSNGCSLKYLNSQTIFLLRRMWWAAWRSAVRAAGSLTLRSSCSWISSTPSWTVTARQSTKSPTSGSRRVSLFSFCLSFVLFLSLFSWRLRGCGVEIEWFVACFCFFLPFQLFSLCVCDGMLVVGRWMGCCSFLFFIVCVTCGQ